MARDESGDEERRARAENLPAKTPLLREGRGQRINADLVSGRKDRARIELLVKKQMRRAFDFNARASPLSLRCSQRTRHFAIDRGPRRLWERGQMQPAIEPDAALHSTTSAFLRHFDRLESHNEGSDQFVRFR